ncbi:hypothetical protein GGI35DRAFT_465637 [Trichoderma velutinum]
MSENVSCSTLLLLALLKMSLKIYLAGVLVRNVSRLCLPYLSLCFLFPFVFHFLFSKSILSIVEDLCFQQQLLFRRFFILGFSNFSLPFFPQHLKLQLHAEELTERS